MTFIWPELRVSVFTIGKKFSLQEDFFFFFLMILLTETRAPLYVSWEHACVVQTCSYEIK